MGNFENLLNFELFTFSEHVSNTNITINWDMSCQTNLILFYKGLLVKNHNFMRVRDYPEITYGCKTQFSKMASHTSSIDIVCISHFISRLRRGLVTKLLHKLIHWIGNLKYIFTHTLFVIHCDDFSPKKFSMVNWVHPTTLLATRFFCSLTKR